MKNSQTVLRHGMAPMIQRFWAAYPWRCALTFTLLALAGVSEGVGIVAMLPVLSLASDEGKAISGEFGDKLYAVFDMLGVQPELTVLLAIIVLGVSLKAGLNLLAARQIGYTIARISADFRLELIRGLLRAQWRHFVTQPVGVVANAVSNQTVRGAAAYQSTLRMFAEAFQAAIYIVLAFLVAPKMALAAIVFGAVMFLALKRLFVAVREAGQAQTDLLKSLVARLTDGLIAIKPLKAMGREDRLAPMLERETADLNTAQRKEVLHIAIMASVHEPALALTAAVGIFWALTYLQVTLVEIIFMVVVMHRIVTRIALVQKHAQALGGQQAAFWAMRAMIDEAEQAAETNPGTRMFRFDRSIAFRDVRFGYGERQVLNGVSLDIPARQLVVLTGPSGAGKTTISDLLAGLQMPASGSITVDGVPLGELDLAAWRSCIGYVPQELFLFHDTILANVTLGDHSLGRDDAEAALKAAGAWDFVASLPDGMDSVVGERGSKLSGGQRQRISIARALVHKPDLLILDEATSALDPVTAREICTTLLNLKQRTAILAISHQSVLLEVADRAYRLDGGSVFSRDVGTTLPDATPAEASMS